MSIFNDLKTSLSTMLEFNYARGEDSARRRVQLDFLKDFINYEAMIYQPEKYKIKINKEEEYIFEESIITRAIQSNLFDSMDDFKTKLSDYKSYEVDMVKFEKPAILKPKVTPLEKAEKEIRKMEEAGISREEAEEIIAEKFMKRKGIVKCAYCQRAINLKTETYRYDPLTKSYYHDECYQEGARESMMIARETSMRTLEGDDIFCGYCGKIITIAQARMGYRSVCEPGVSDMSSKCAFFHANFEPPYNCWWIKKQIEKVGK